jgi:hypothetical protein
MSRRFPLGVVLSVTTERLVAPIADVHEFLEYMAGEPVWTHQLPRVMDEARPVIFTQHPQLVDAIVPDGADGPDWVDGWLAAQTARFGATLEVKPLEAIDHTSIDPVSELRMRGVPAARIVVVDPRDGAP